jgi:protein-L-isoaspartate(D-aspartate) O-methyltransferase
MFLQALLGLPFSKGDGRPHGSTEDTMAARRERMVEEQIKRRGIKDKRVLRAMGQVERHRFLPHDQWPSAYGDHPLPIGEEQTISQPYIVALMTEALGLGGTEKILEVGTGCGYQTAILAELARAVYSVEILPRLARGARAILDELGYRNVQIQVGDGHLGWPEHGPYDGILVAAAPREVPAALLSQLKEVGKLVIPVGLLNQELEVHTRRGDKFRVERIASVRFVPLIKEGAR